MTSKVEVLLSPLKVPDYKDNVKEPGLGLKSFNSKYIYLHLCCCLYYLGLKATYEYMSSSYPFIIRGAFTQLPALKKYDAHTSSFLSDLSFPFPLSWFRFTLPGTMAPFIHAYNQVGSHYASGTVLVAGDQYRASAVKELTV